MCTRESESERRNNDFFRFAERAQTDFGVGAVINWAREVDLGPEVFLYHSSLAEIFCSRTFSYLEMWTR